MTSSLYSSVLKNVINVSFFISLLYSSPHFSQKIFWDSSSKYQGLDLILIASWHLSQLFSELILIFEHSILTTNVDKLYFSFINY